MTLANKGGAPGIDAPLPSKFNRQPTPGVSGNLKVLHVSLNLSPEAGGTTQAILDLTRSLKACGMEVGLITTANPDHEDLRSDNDQNVRTFRQGWLRKLWTGHAQGISQYLAREAGSYDLIHIHELWSYPHYAASVAARRHSKPFIVTPHGMLNPWAMAHKAWKKRVYWLAIQREILNRAAAIHTLSDDEETYVRRHGLTNRVALIPNGINVAEFGSLPPKSTLAKMFPEVTDKQVILFLGRIHPIKGLDLLASSFVEIASRRDDVRLVFAGPDNYAYRSQLEAILGRGNVLSKSIFTGMLQGQDKLAALSGSDILVLPSYSEVRGMATLEGMASQLPVVITQQCGFPEVESAGAGIVIDHDHQQLAAALERLLDNPRLRHEMGKRGRQLVLEQFTWDRAAAQMHQLYQEVLKSWPEGD